MNSLPYSPHWRTLAVLSAALLLLDVSLIGFKASQQTGQATVEDVFAHDKPQFSPDLGQLTAIVPPTAYEAPPPDVHGPQYRTGDWVKAQGSMNWTLQVVESADEEEAKAFLLKRPDRDKFAYFSIKSGAALHYVVVYDAFPTRELALGVAAGLDLGLANGARPAPVKFSSYLPALPILEPAIDQPPAPQYGEVPEVANPGVSAEAPAEVSGEVPVIAPQEPTPATPETTAPSGNAGGNEDSALFR